MSKSKGNFYTLRDLLARGHDSLAIRFELLHVPYRKQLNFTMDGLTAAKRSLDRVKDFLFRLKSATLSKGSDEGVEDAVRKSREQFESGMDDDLNTAQALGAMFELVRDMNIAMSQNRVHEENRKEILAFFDTIDKRLAIVPEVEPALQKDEEIEALIAKRNEARKNRDFALSDKIRQELLARGILIEDTKDGTRWRRK